MANRNPIASVSGRCVSVEPLARSGTGEVWGYNVVLDQGRGVTARCTAYPEVLAPDIVGPGSPADLVGKELTLEVEVSARTYTREGQQRYTVNFDVVAVSVPQAVSAGK